MSASGEKNTNLPFPFSFLFFFSVYVYCHVFFKSNNPFFLSVYLEITVTTNRSWWYVRHFNRSRLWVVLSAMPAISVLPRYCLLSICRCLPITFFSPIGLFTVVIWMPRASSDYSIRCPSSAALCRGSPCPQVAPSASLTLCLHHRCLYISLLCPGLQAVREGLSPPISYWCWHPAWAPPAVTWPHGYCSCRGSLGPLGMRIGVLMSASSRWRRTPTWWRTNKVGHSGIHNCQSRRVRLRFLVHSIGKLNTHSDPW